MKLLIGLLATIVILWLSSLNWRHTLKVVLILVVIEGALRKWVLPQANELIYFLKDIVLLGAYIKYFIFSASEKKYLIKSEVIKPLIFITTGWCLFQAFNSSLGSPIIGIFGLKSYLFYAPLIWMVPNLFQSEEELYNFLKKYMLLIIPVSVLGIIQFFSPASSPINAYSNDEGTANVVTFANDVGVRITGTFSYISGYSLYLVVCFGLLIPIISFSRSFWWTWVAIIEMLLVTVNSFMTGSRTTIIASALFLLGYLAIQGITRPGSTILTLRKLVVPVIFVAIASSIWFRPAIEAYWNRSTSSSSDSVSERIILSIVQPFDFMKFKELDGYGTGATHQADTSIRRILGLPNGETIPVGYETEMGRIALELGPVGFILWYTLRLVLAIALFLVFWKSKRPLLRQLALAACLIQSIQISGLLVFHNTFPIYYWFLSGFIFLLPRLEKIESWSREQKFPQDVEATYFPNSPHG